MRTARTWALAMGGIALLVACDAQVDSDYRGEPLATISGTIINERSRPLEGEVEVGLIWNGRRGAAHGVTGQVAALSTAFPADYTLDLHAPPPPEARVVGELWAYVCEGDEWCKQYPDEVEAQLRDEFNALSIAHLLVAKKGSFAALGQDPYHLVQPGSDPEIDPDVEARLKVFWRSLLGGARGTVLYVDRDFGPDSYVARALGGPVAAGYHFMPLLLPSDATFEALDECLEKAEEDALTELYCILDAFSELRPLQSIGSVELRIVDEPEQIFPSGSELE